MLDCVGVSYNLCDQSGREGAQYETDLTSGLSSFRDAKLSFCKGK